MTTSLTARGDNKLRQASYVKVTDPPEAPLTGFREGVYVVSAQLVAPGSDGETLSWAVSREMLRTGGGLAFGMDAVTREFSDLGAAASSDSPAADYTSELAATDAFERSRACAER